MAKLPITINSVRATNKDNNVMEISYNIGKKLCIIKADCTNITPYQAIETDIKVQGKDFIRDCVKSYDSYNESPVCSEDIDLIAKKLIALSGGNNKSGYDNFELNQFMRVITA